MGGWEEEKGKNDGAEKLKNCVGDSVRGGAGGRRNVPMPVPSCVNNILR